MRLGRVSGSICSVLSSVHAHTGVPIMSEAQCANRRGLHRLLEEREHIRLTVRKLQ